MLYALLAFQVKHFVCDFPLQSSYQARNKGSYGHPGGVWHASIHAAGTLMICLAFGMPWWLAAVEWPVHYHIDWAKVRLSRRLQLTPTDNGFWWLFGFDQFLHQLTYLALVAAA